jgi:hypothetical protein
MLTLRPPALSRRPILVGLLAGAVIGGSPFAYALPLADRLLFSLGLFLTYASIGVLVTSLPRIGPRWLFGLIVGGLYSLPGSVLVAVPYPLRPDAPVYYRNFAAGGAEEFAVTLAFGLGVGLACGLAIPADGGPRPHDPPALEEPRRAGGATALSR